MAPCPSQSQSETATLVCPPQHTLMALFVRGVHEFAAPTRVVSAVCVVVCFCVAAACGAASTRRLLQVDKRIMRPHSLYEALLRKVGLHLVKKAEHGLQPEAHTNRMGMYLAGSCTSRGRLDVCVTKCLVG